MTLWTQKADSAPSLFEPTRQSKTTLPLELHAYIINSFDSRKDSGTIVCCALVCRVWLHLSRRKLYSHITLTRHRQWERFKHHLIHPAPHMVPYLQRTKELYVSLPRAYDIALLSHLRMEFYPLYTTGENPNERPWVHLVLDYCALNLPSLSELTFMGINWSNSSVRSNIFVTRGPYQSITALRLDGCSFSSIRQLQRFITALPALNGLSLGSIILLQSITPMRQLRAAGPSFTRLEILNCSPKFSIPLCQWLAVAGFVRASSHIIWQPGDEERLENAWKDFSGNIRDEALESLKCTLNDEWTSMYYRY